MKESSLYVIGVLLFALLGLGAYAWHLDSEVSALKLEAEKVEKAAIAKGKKDLEIQKKAHEEALLLEQRRRFAVEVQNDKLIQRVKEIADAKARLATSVCVGVNGLFDRARSQFGGVPTDSTGPASGRTDACEKSLNEDLVGELTKAWTWCEAGWTRVQAIARVQSSCTAGQ